jgi:hypothetical protein
MNMLKMHPRKGTRDCENRIIQVENMVLKHPVAYSTITSLPGLK